MISAIVCVDENWGIGSNGDLLIHIPEDMKFFKEKTIGNTVIMGRKTYDSLHKKPLPNRENVVITNKPMLKDGIVFANLNRVKDVFEFMNKFNEQAYNNMFIIGGGQIYKELLPYCEYAYVTKVYRTYENVDTYFPNIDKMQEWEIECQSEIKEYNDVKYQFYTYRKKV